MMFNQPTFLWGLLGLSIPIFYHLFQLRRYKTVYYSDIRFLKQVKDKSSQRRKIEHWLILLLRLLAITFFVFAFADPQWGTTPEKENKTVGLYIDLSPSMNVDEFETPIYLKVLSDARDIVADFPLDAEFRLYGHPQSSNGIEVLHKNDIINLIDQTDRATFDFQIASIDKTKFGKFIAFSDFQKSDQWEPFLADTHLTAATLLDYSVADSLSNSTIDSIWFSSPESHLNTTQSLFARVLMKPVSESPTAKVELFLNGELQSVTQGEINARGECIVQFDLYHKSSGWTRGELKLEDPNYRLDNSFYFSYYVKDKYNILHYYQEQPFKKLESVFSREEMNYQKAPITDLDNSQIEAADLIVLEGVNSLSPGWVDAISQHIGEGANLLILESNQLSSMFQGPSPIESENNQWLTLEAKDPFYTGVFSKEPKNTQGITLPSSRVMTPPYNRVYPLYVNTLGNAFASRWNLGNGNVVWLGNTPVELDASTLANDWFPVFFSRSLLFERSPAVLYLKTGTSEGFALRARKTDQSPIRLIDKDGAEWIPQQQTHGQTTHLYLHPEWNRAGLFTAVLKTDTIGAIGINNPSHESELIYYHSRTNSLEREGIQFIDGDKKVTSFAKDYHDGSSIWKYCLIFAILFLMVEGLFFRLRRN